MSHQESHVIFAECFEEMSDEEILGEAINEREPLTPWQEAVLKECADRGLARIECFPDNRWREQTPKRRASGAHI